MANQFLLLVRFTDKKLALRLAAASSETSQCEIEYVLNLRATRATSTHLLAMAFE
jgi:hypothetical protein